ncbi:MAG: histidinol dehydrogenase [Methanoregulaceae archaeon]|nr:histidinol dehydrogenase [Methanoregulaceae archaeon]
MMRKLVSGVDDVPAILAARSIGVDDAVRATVAEIIDDVRRRGDAALLDAVRRFDAPGLDALVAADRELEAAEAALSEEQHAALQTAIDRVMRFHEAQLYYFTETMESVSLGPSRFDGLDHVAYHWSEETDHGGHLGQQFRSVRRAGVYVPGGEAAYPSSVYMNVAPANVALVPEVVVTTPARKDGSLPPAVLVAARHCHVDRIVKVGGAAAIAALALGTESVSKCDVVVGPGNRYVNEAKRQLWGSVGLDGYAGPSEVCVLFDESANPAWVAADLLTQVEHAADNAGFLVTTSEPKLAEVLVEVERQLSSAARESTMRSALETHGLALVARSLDEAVDWVNLIAPEHLSLAISEADEVVSRIENAGCILVGEWTPESGGDYAVGPSHTLPTAGAARFGSPVNVLTFMKVQSVVRLGEGDLRELAPAMDTLAQMEGFPTHGRGATIRLDE